MPMARILVVEDEAPVRQLIRIALESVGYKVVETPNGAEGLQRYQAEPTDLVITDLHLPVMDGRQMIRELRRRFPATRILAISGDRDILDQSRALHIQGTLHKPFTLADLLATVQKLLQL
jgi:CheY-like chemotaxis protein